MKKLTAIAIILQFFTIFFANFSNANSQTCELEKKEDSICKPFTEESRKIEINRLLDVSIGGIVSIANHKSSLNEQRSEMYKLIQNNVAVEVFAKRVIGRSRWNELTCNEQKNFLAEYPKYFVGFFRDIIIASISNVKTYTTNEVQGIKNTYKVAFSSNKPGNKDLIIEIVVLESCNSFKILDGVFENISILKSQQDNFDRLYSEDKNIFKTFKAEDYIPKNPSGKDSTKPSNN